MKLYTNTAGSNVKEILESGTSADELRKQLDKEIKAAERDIAAEKTKTSAIEKAKTELIDALVNYMVATGIMSKDEITEEGKKDLKVYLDKLPNGFKWHIDWSNGHFEDTILKDWCHWLGGK